MVLILHWIEIRISEVSWHSVAYFPEVHVQFTLNKKVLKEIINYLNYWNYYKTPSDNYLYVDTQLNKL